VGVDFVIKHVCDNKKGGERESKREKERGLFNLKQSLDVAQPKRERERERRVKPETVM
jgi:hypothetical protein